MICMRCGYCCINYPVVIVDDPEKGISEDNLIIKGGEAICKHLKGDGPGNFSCAIHDYEWFQDTPCGRHTQIEYKDSECRIGFRLMRELQNGKAYWYNYWIDHSNGFIMEGFIQDN